MEHIEDKVIERMKKLLLMSKDESSPQEAKVASDRLKTLLQKHNITLEDLEGKNEPVFEKWYRYKTDYEKKLLLQIHYKVINADTHHYKPKRKKLIGLDATEADHVEIKRLYDIYRVELKKHFDLAYSAFIQANKIFSNGSEPKPEYLDFFNISFDIDPVDVEPKPLSIEERRRVEKLLNMAKQIEPASVYQELE